MGAGDHDDGTKAALPPNAIAVIGMAGRFPGADTVAALWAALREGRDLVTHFSDADLEDSFSAEERAAANFVKARPILKDVDQFDAGFFGMYPREAALLDPQHRLMLEVAWEAFEDAGIDPHLYPGAIGVFAGCTYNSYFLQHVLGTREAVEDFTSTLQLGEYARFAGAMGDTLATRVAYKFNLRGPAMSVQSCCSTSLLAIAQACQSLILYQSDMALAGGVSITFPQKRGYHAIEGGMASVDGACRPFDADAGGTIFGHGAGVVLLKRLEDAVADGDRIYAIIRSAAVNNDGADKVGFTAPSVDGQAAVIMTAHMTAGVDARSIGYVEAHGTATPMGDPIEVAGLTKAFEASTADRQFCALGSVKANLGHLDAAAGVVGFIKAALTLRHNEIPPLANYKAPNPRIDFAQTPFFIADKAQPYPATDGPRRAGVSSFGVGGTNVHVLLEEAPVWTAGALAGNPNAFDASSAGEAPAVHILPISAKSEGSVNAMKAALADHLEAHPELALGHVAATLQIARRAFDKRTVIAARDRDEAIAKLRAPSPVLKAAETAPPIIFMFPGQGAQYPGMTAGLYQREPLFASIIDRGAEVLKPLLGLDIRDPLYNQPDAGEDSHHPIRSTILAQPALFLTEYATARLLMSWGVRPNSMVGHSVGEFVAACIAGVMKFEDALTLIAARGRLMQAQDPGAMLSIRLPEAEARPLLGDDVDLAAINGPNLVVAAGPFAAIEALEARLTDKNVTHRRLHTSHAFHSRMMDGALAPLREEAARMRFAPPKICYASGLTGTWMSDEEAVDPSTWARHCRETVRFADALATACKGRKPILIEIGAGKTLSMLAAQIVAKSELAGIVNTLPDVSREPEDNIVIAEALGRLWAVGAAVTFDALRSPDAQRVSLPTYRFDRQRHWIDAPTRAAATPAPTEALPPSAAALFVPPVQSFIAAPIAPPASSLEPIPSMSAQMTPDAHKAALADQLVKILEDLSGEQIAGQDPNTTFLELGFDSLFLGQVAQAIQSKFGVKLTFRQLLGDYPNVEAVSAHLATIVPIPAAAPVAAPAIAAAPVAMQAAPMPMMTAPVAANGDMASLFQMQLAAMQNVIAQQFAMMQGGAPVISAQPQVAAPAPQALAPAPVQAVSPAAKPATEEDDTPARFKMYRAGASAQKTETSNAQRAFIEDLIALVNAKTPTAKKLTQQNRPVLADPRTAAGFRLEWKELVYPIVSDRSKGSRVWDLDGNEYVDLVNGYGQTAFGHAPDFVSEAIAEQLAKGFAIGPQTPMAGEVAAMVSPMIGMERITFCNTGSEAVMAAMRVARAVSGKRKVVVFNNDYHGQFDEVLVRPGPRRGPPGAAPVAPGITPENVANMVVLAYDDPASLDWIKANTHEIAAVLVEPVQSRHPELQPVEFVRSLRAITEQNDVALIFDEVVTGFRAHPGGVQALWNIRADLATYGKVVGGGMPIGILAGTSKYMDALDGGQWAYGDDSLPEVAPTFFAGTFVRHPLVMAAARAVMHHLEAEGPALQQRLTAATTKLVDRINADLARRGLTTRANQFSSFFYFNIGAEDRLGSLFYPLARSKGVNIQEGFPCYLTTAHSDADYKFIGDVFEQALDELQAVGILTGGQAPVEAIAASAAPALVATAALAVAAGPAEAPLTEPQTEVWLAAQLGDAASASFNEGMTLRMDGALNLDALNRAVNDVVARHDALRASFNASGEKMHIAPELKIELQTFDVSAEANPEAALLDLQRADAAMPFDLVRGPLFRAFLAKLASDKHALVFTAHHIVCDGWSVNVVLEELSALYAAHAKGAAPDLKAPLSYAQYAADYAKRAGDRAAAEKFWLAKYQDGIPDLPELPYDRQRPALKTFAGATFSGQIEAALYKDVKKAGAKQGCTLFATLFASMQVLVGRLSNQNDIVLAVPTAGQSLLDDEILVGHCVNFLPFRAPFDPAAPFAAHLANVKREVLDAFEHQDYTFGTLVRKLAVKRDLNRLPMTEIQFNLERIGQKLDLPGLKTSAGPNGKAFSNFDMFWNVIESESGLRIDVDYNTDILDEATIARWIDHFRALLTAVAADATQPIKALPLLSAADRAWLKQKLNATESAFPRDALVHELVSAQAARTPDKIAATDGKREISYARLEASSNTLARRLQEIARQPGSRIAIATDRTTCMLAALLGVMKAGHAYVPLDPTHPASRLKQIIDGADIAALVCDDDASEALAPAGVPTLRLDLSADAANDSNGHAPKRIAANGDRPAYVIFTSGSTGAPKGVEVPHRAFVNFLISMSKAPGFTADDSLISVTTISFDIAGLELFLPLITGGRVSIASRDDVRGGFGLIERIGREKPSVVQATPSLWRMMLEAGFKPSPSLKMLCGGEPLPRDLADQLLEGGGELWNMYGPTETTIWSSCGRVRKNAPIIIGAPIDNTQLHILDANDQLAPIGVTGDLYIGGDGLANGYFNQPELTKKVFRDIALDGGPAQRLYKTGDVGRRLVDGSIQLLGRTDHQIKLRGFRIELEDIESAMRRTPGVAACAAAVREVNGDKRLVGYIVPAPGAQPKPQDIAAFLAGQLPDYMVPAMWMFLDALPLTPNKKLDRKALPTPDPAVAATAARTITPPRTPIESQMAEIWCGVLTVKEIGVHDNLFSLGADSLHVFRIAARMMEKGIKLEAKHLLQKPTIAELAELLAAQDRGEATAPKTPSLRDFRGGARRRQTN